MAASGREEELCCSADPSRTPHDERRDKTQNPSKTANEYCTTESAHALTPDKTSALDIGCALFIHTEREVVCTSEKIVVNLSFKRPFVGVAFVQNQYKTQGCRWRGNGSHFLLIMIPLNTSSGMSSGSAQRTAVGPCMIAVDEVSGEHSTTLIISDDPAILTDGSFALTVKCAFDHREDLLITIGAPSLDSSPSSFKTVAQSSMPTMGNSESAPSLSILLREGHGIAGRNISEVAVGQRFTLDVTLQDTSIYDLFVHSCMAHDGSREPEATLSIVDLNGCAVKLSKAVDAPVFTSLGSSGDKHIYIHIYGFQFTSSDTVQFECKATPCIYSCEKKQCGENATALIAKNKSAPPLQDYTLRVTAKVTPQRLLAVTVPTAMRWKSENSMASSPLLADSLSPNKIAMSFVVLAMIMIILLLAGLSCTLSMRRTIQN